MNFDSKLASGSIIALIMGVCLASPLLFLNIGSVHLNQSGPKAQIGVDVSYAYFDLLSANENVTGLWRNSSNLDESLPFVAYFFVLNVTNYSNFTVELDRLGVSAQKGPYFNFTDMIANNKSIVANYPIVSDYRNFADSDGSLFDNSFEPNQSRLIAVSGIQTVWSSTAFETLTTGKILLVGQAFAIPRGSSRYLLGSADTSQQVQLDIFGSEFLYNALVSEDQLLKIHPVNYLDVTIEPRR